LTATKENEMATTIVNFDPDCPHCDRGKVDGGGRCKSRECRESKGVAVDPLLDFLGRSWQQLGENQ
jgi:hypothetical protein